MPLSITHQIRIESTPGFWYTVENTHLDCGGEGVTISYWESSLDDRFRDGTRKLYLCLTIDNAEAVLNAMQQLLDETGLLRAVKTSNCAPANE
jgi:hypothetical protein